MNPDEAYGANFSITETTVYGLQLPSGHVIWPDQNWHGHSTRTEEGRDNIVAAIVKSAANMGFGDSEELLAKYCWRTRRITTYITSTMTDTDERLPLRPPSRPAPPAPADAGPSASPAS